MSWLILWIHSREHIAVLGFTPTPQRLMLFFLGGALMALFCAINLVGQAYFTDVHYVRNSDYGWSHGLNATWWTLKAALLEELIFRGALLYILIKRIGMVKACVLSAIAFGIYHWFSYEMFGRGIVPMTYVFLLTGAAGWMFAYSYAKTRSILIPLGLHFGWIVMSIVFLSDGPLGQSFFVHDGEAGELGGWEQLMFFLWQTLVIPGLVTWYFAKRYKLSHEV